MDQNKNNKIIGLYEKIKNNEGLLQSLKTGEVFLCPRCQDFKRPDEFTKNQRWLSELKLITKKYDIKNVCKMKKDCSIENIKKQVALKMLDKNPFCKLDKSLFKQENNSLKNIYQKIMTDYKISFRKAVINNLKQCNIQYKISYIDKALNEMLEVAQNSSAYEKDDKISIALFNPNIKTPIYTELRSDDVLTNLKSIINGVLTSNEEIDITETTFQVQVIKNDDNLCCPRAIIVALATQTNNILGHKLDFNKIRQLKMELCKMLTEYNKEGFTLVDIKNVESILDIQIIIVCAEHFNTVIYKGEDKEIKIYLYKNGNHFDVIWSMQGFYGSSYYCKKCDTSYNNKDKHKCVKDKNVCKLCMKSEHLSSTKNRIYCEDCNRYCYNQECLDDYFYVCMYVCTETNILEPRIDKCGYSIICRNCEEEVKINEYKCYMQPIIEKGDKCNTIDCTKCNKGNTKYKSQQETGIHIANKIIAHDFEGNKIMFDTNEEFCKHVISEEYRGYTLIAHYAKGYDSQFILKYLVDKTLKPFRIYSGTKLMLLENKYLSIRKIDSSNFIQCPLSSFPKTFGLKELKKVEIMKPGNKIEFENEELVAYCTSDVDILRRGCLELRKQFLEIVNIDPFRYTTIAGVCMAIYRLKYLLKDTIAVLDKEKNECYSKQSITWLQNFNNKNISHALNGGEKTIAGNKVDGFDNKSKTVYQFHGCFWHGCTKCFKDREIINNISHETMDDLYQKTIERSTAIKNAGYNLVEQWACDWLNSITYKNMKKADIADPINPRDAFFGGRTNATILRVKNTKMRYIDICSLYPTVNYYDYYPVGHPEKIFEPKVFDKKWFGLIKCKILPPRNLYHPVLPVKVKMEKSEKLLFPLCYKCAVDQNERCDHSQNERQFIGTWTTDEVNKALEKGYIITNIYEVWHFKEKSTDLFKAYVKDFIKIKLETSKHNYSSNEEYIKIIFDKLGILLDKDKIGDNPGRRAVAKVCLNSLWGKFGQRQKMKKTEFVTDPQQLYKILLDDRLENINIQLLNDNMVQMCYNYKNYYVQNHHNTNILVALFTTSSARLRLYKMLDKLGRAVVYFDTDSIFYTDNGDNIVKTGTMLGEWTDELGENVYITDWTSTGPKSYYYKTNYNKFKTVIKGFTLNYQNLLKLNRESMIKLIEENNNNNNIELEYNQITRNPLNKTLVNKTVTKKLSFEYDKRIILPDYDTILYGYK
ncbi:hypothetical protein QTP88_028871 [Uroleucon formosanum]